MTSEEVKTLTHRDLVGIRKAARALQNCWDALDQVEKAYHYNVRIRVRDISHLASKMPVHPARMDDEDLRRCLMPE